MQASLKRAQATAFGQLAVAATEGDIETVKDIIARGHNIDQGDYDGRTTLHLAVSEHRLDIVKLLLDKGCNCSVLDTWGKSPLQEALDLDDLAIAEELCSKGAQVTKASVALLLGVADNEDKVRLLCTKAGVNVDIIDTNGKTALHYACADSLWRSCQNLLRLGANANVKDRCADQAYLYSARSQLCCCVVH